MLEVCMTARTHFLPKKQGQKGHKQTNPFTIIISETLSQLSEIKMQTFLVDKNCPNFTLLCIEE
jgi:hypothetical protein